MHLPCTKDSGCGCGLLVTATSMLWDGCVTVALIAEVKVLPGGAGEISLWLRSTSTQIHMPKNVHTCPTEEFFVKTHPGQGR